MSNKASTDHPSPYGKKQSRYHEPIARCVDGNLGADHANSVYVTITFLQVAFLLFATFTRDQVMSPTTSTSRRGSEKRGELAEGQV